MKLLKIETFCSKLEAPFSKSCQHTGQQSNDGDTQHVQRIIGTRCSLVSELMLLAQSCYTLFKPNTIFNI